MLAPSGHVGDGRRPGASSSDKTQKRLFTPSCAAVIVLGFAAVTELLAALF